VKTVTLILFLALFSNAHAQKGYVEQQIVGGDTSLVHHEGQRYWKLFQGVKDAIIETNLPEGGNIKKVKYPIKSREYDGYLVTFVVEKSATEDFTIVFHTGDKTVTYIFEDKTLLFRGKAIRFALHD